MEITYFGGFFMDYEISLCWTNFMEATYFGELFGNYLWMLFLKCMVKKLYLEEIYKCLYRTIEMKIMSLSTKKSLNKSCMHCRLDHHGVRNGRLI